MTRIIAGSASGRRLRTPSGEATRPTSDRVREALFSRVESWFDGLAGLRVLDLYAGSGALALEALSRGAADATAVESDRRTAGLIAGNARDLGLDLRVRTGRVATVVGAGEGAAFRGTSPDPMTPGETHDAYDLVLADPPYPLPTVEVEGVLAALVERGWLAEEALVVVERSSRSPAPSTPAGLRVDATRAYGETVLYFYSTVLGVSSESEGATS